MPAMIRSVAQKMGLSIAVLGAPGILTGNGGSQATKRMRWIPDPPNAMGRIQREYFFR